MRHHRALNLLGFALASLFLAGCAVPLGPGYRIEQESLSLRLAPARLGGATQLEVRATYRLRNIGNRSLSSIEVALPSPDASGYGRRNLRVLLDGREILPQQAALALPALSGVEGSGVEGARQAPSIQIPFDPPWTSQQTRDLVIEYALEPPVPGNARIAVNQNSVHLRDYGWFPRLLPPSGLFAKGGHRPRKARLTIRLPEGFRILASGREKGVTRQGGEAEYLVEWQRGDPEPFLVAGRYSETRADRPEGTVIFWTFSPLESSAAQAAAARIYGSLTSYEKFFGPLPGRQGPLWIVETPARLPSHTRSAASGESPAGIGFPGGALLNERAFALGVSSDAFLELVEHELAHAWFGPARLGEPADDGGPARRSLPAQAGLGVGGGRPEAEVFMTEGLVEYAVLVADEARGGDAARRSHIAGLLRWYDEARQNAAEKPLIALEPNDPWEQRAFGHSKGALFFVALEDECGKDVVRHGLARMVGALHGKRPPAAFRLGSAQAAGRHELRAAIEDEAGRDLADFFRIWLNHPGIPPAFRARYE